MKMKKNPAYTERIK